MSDEKQLVSSTPIWVSTWHCRKEGCNAVGVKEKIVDKYSDGSIDYRDNLKIYPDPVRSFWITKPNFRNYKYKKEFEDKEHCEEYKCNDSNLIQTIENMLELPPLYYKKRSIKQVCASPYVYGADIDTPTLIKQHYVNNTPVGMVAQFSKGGLDIESEVTDQKRINVITFIHENKIYTAALREYCKIWNDKKTEYKEATELDIRANVLKLLQTYFDKYNFELHIKVCETEIDEIIWIFDRIHECKTDYIGIWNLGFDIPKIIERIEALGEDPARIMCHPDVPFQYRFVEWSEDKSVTQHFTDKWHWITIAGYSQFIDSMCLYARLRKVHGRDSSYSLDDISTKEIGAGKLHFGAITNHWYAQHYQFVDYIAYNINDVILMQVMEWQNNDMGALSGLSGMSLLSQFSRQTVMVRNDAYNYGRERGKIPSSAGLKMFTPYDEKQPKAGGTVLPPNKAVGVGIAAIDKIDRPTQVCLFTNDLDVSSMYPSVTSAFNISKETAKATVLKINGRDTKDTEVFFSNINQPDINAVFLCENFFHLPGYEQMEEEFKKFAEYAPKQ